MKLSILVPSYNEEQTIEKVLHELKSVKLIGGFEAEIIVIDDCSADRTGQIVKSFIAKHPETNVAYYRHEVNRGKGAALHTGIIKASGDYIIVQDADLEYDPAEFNILLLPVIKGFADVVYGSRFMGGKAHRVLFFWHTIGNKVLTSLSNVFSNLNLTDMETCYKLFRADILKSMVLIEKRFGFEPEVTAKIAKVPNIRIYEVGISYYGRTYEEGKKINWKDGFRAIYCIFRYGIGK
jgi:glycosyltransferase involved in cell wall biosynthesis